LAGYLWLGEKAGAKKLTLFKSIAA
jgi:hypothetical protein